MIFFLHFDSVEHNKRAGRAEVTEFPTWDAYREWVKSCGFTDSVGPHDYAYRDESTRYFVAASTDYYGLTAIADKFNSNAYRVCERRSIINDSTVHVIYVAFTDVSDYVGHSKYLAWRKFAASLGKEF